MHGLMVHFCVTHGGVAINNDEYGFRVMFVLCHALTLLPLPGRVLTVLEASALCVRLRPHCKSGPGGPQSVRLRVVLVRYRARASLWC